MHYFVAHIFAGKIVYPFTDLVLDPGDDRPKHTFRSKTVQLADDNDFIRWADHVEEWGHKYATSHDEMVSCCTAVGRDRDRSLTHK